MSCLPGSTASPITTYTTTEPYAGEMKVSNDVRLRHPSHHHMRMKSSYYCRAAVVGKDNSEQTDNLTSLPATDGQDDFNSSLSTFNHTTTQPLFLPFTSTTHPSTILQTYTSNLQHIILSKQSRHQQHIPPSPHHSTPPSSRKWSISSARTAIRPTSVSTHTKRT